MVSLREVAETVATDATNPEYEPQRPAMNLAEDALPPVVVTTARSRETPPLVVSRLQPTGAPPPRTPRFERLRTQIARTLAAYQQRPLNTAQHTPWEVMHGFIAFGIPTQVRVGGPAGGLVNALGWTVIGLTIRAWILAIRRRRALSIGAIGGLLIGWMLPALARTLGECFRHCWMHEGLLGTIALAGGTALRAVGVLAELPWTLLAGEGSAVTPILAIPVSAGIWIVVGAICSAVVEAVRHSSSDRDGAPEGVGGTDVETAL